MKAKMSRTPSHRLGECMAVPVHPKLWTIGVLEHAQRFSNINKRNGFEPPVKDWWKISDILIVLAALLLLAGCYANVQSTNIAPANGNNVAEQKQAEPEAAGQQTAAEENKQTSAKSSAEVIISDKSVDPEELKAGKGSVIVFINKGDNDKKLIGSISSGWIKSGGKFEATLGKGSYEYVVLPFKFRAKIIIE